MGNVAMSLCGGLRDPDTISEESFLHHLVMYDDFCQNPDMMNNADFVVRIDDKWVLYM